MEELIENFDDEIERFISEEEIDSEDCIRLEESLADVIIKNYKKPTAKALYDSKKKLKFFDLNKSIKLAKEFIEEYYGKEYLDKFIYALDNIFTFDINLNLDCSYYNPSTNELYLNLFCDITDPLTIVHEFMHYVNNNMEVISYASEYFTEAISFYNELLFEDFILDKHKNMERQLKVNRHEREYIMYMRAVQFKILSHLLKAKLKGNKLNMYFLEEALEELSYVSDDDIEDALSNIIFTLDEGIFPDFGSMFDNASSYVVAGVFSKYLYALHKKNKDISIDINEVLKDYDVEDLYNFLDVEIYKEIDEEIYDYQEQNEEDFSIPIVIKEKEQKKLEYIYKRQKRA